MTREEIKEILDGFGLYCDPDHPDHISGEKFETLEPPFMEWGTQDQAFRADGIDYLTWKELTVRIFSDTDEDAPVLTAGGIPVTDAIREAFDKCRIEKSYYDELGLYLTTYTMEV